MEDLTEAELEAFILSKNGTPEARYVLGKLMIEGTSKGVPKNENKGFVIFHKRMVDFNVF